MLERFFIEVLRKLDVSPTPIKNTLTVLLLLMFSATLSRAQQYVEAPRPKCDSYTMQNRISLTALEKTCYYRDHVFSPSAVSGAAIFAGIAQATNSPPEWPQGAKGFAWRVGTRYVQGMAKTTGGYLAGLALHEDPRSVRPDCSRPHDANGIVTLSDTPKSFWRRVGGAVAVNFWTKNDSCKMRPAFAASAGALSSGFVGMAWTPDSSNTISKALVRSGTALGGSIGSSIFTEFQGDITHGVSKLFGRKPSSGGGSQQ
jgi:hypothetical protein